MPIRIHAMAALALSVGVCASACSEVQPAPQGQAPAGGTGGYGPFGGNAPTETTQAPMSAQGGAETILVGAASGAPPEFQALVGGYLDDYTQQMAAGWTRLPGVPDTIVALNLNEEHRMQVQLRAGQHYGFIGACDNECGNLDLVLEDATGARVDADELEDDYPLVEIAPRADGVYTLRIQLKSCSIAPCYVGARLVRRP